MNPHYPAIPGTTMRAVTGSSQATAITAAGPSPAMTRDPVSMGRPSTVAREARVLA